MSDLSLPKTPLLKALRMLISTRTLQEGNCRTPTQRAAGLGQTRTAEGESDSEGKGFTRCHAQHFSASSQLSEMVTQPWCFPHHKLTGWIFSLSHSYNNYYP